MKYHRQKRARKKIATGDAFGIRGESFRKSARTLAVSWTVSGRMRERGVRQRLNWQADIQRPPAKHPKLLGRGQRRHNAIGVLDRVHPGENESRAADGKRTRWQCRVNSGLAV